VVRGGLQVTSDGREGFGAGKAVKAAGDLVVIWRCPHITTYGRPLIMGGAGRGAVRAADLAWGWLHNQRLSRNASSWSAGR
jgi:hypothetical protein